MDEILTEFKNHLRVHGRDITYYYKVKVYLEYCEYTAVDYKNYKEITVPFLEGFMLYLQSKNLERSTITNHIKSVRFFNRFLIDRNLIDEEVLTALYKIKTGKVERKIKDYLTKAELDELITMAEGWYDGMDIYKMKALLYFMFFTGIRKGELLNLKRKYINLEERESIIKLPNKGKEERYIYFTKEVKNLLDRYFNMEPEYTNAFNITAYKLTNLIDYIEQFTDKKITPHTMRHSFGQYLALNEIDIKIAQKLLGHKNLSSTEIYYDPTKETVKNIYKKKLG